MARKRLIARDAEYERLIGCAGCIAVAKLKLPVGRVEDAERGDATTRPITHYRIAVGVAVLYGQVCEPLRIAAAQIECGVTWPENADRVGFVSQGMQVEFG